MPSFSRDLEESLHRTIALANQRRHEYATLEHLLLSLTEDPDARIVFKRSGADIAAIQTTVRRYIDNELGKIVWDEGDAKPTAGFQRAVQLAVLQYQTAQGRIAALAYEGTLPVAIGQDEVNGSQLLLAITYDQESYACRFLNDQGITKNSAALIVASLLSEPLSSKLSGIILECFSVAYDYQQAQIEEFKEIKPKSSPPRTKVGRAVARNKKEILLQSSAIRFMIDERIKHLKEQRPNNEASIKFNEEQIDEFEKIKFTISSLEGMISRSSEADRSEEELVSIADEIHRIIVGYIRKNGQEALHLTFKGALISLLTVVGSLCGVAPITATAMSVIVGGKVVVDGLKAVRGAPSRRRS